MFRNKFLLRIEAPFSSFLLVKLALSQPSPDFYSIQSLCWNLSRTLRLPCFSQSPDIFVIYQRSQSESAERAIKQLSQALPITNVSAVEEVASGVSGPLIAKAVDCALRSFFLEEAKWCCLGDNCIVRSDFGVNEEKNHLCALHATVQADIDNSFIFLVSPDVVHFKRPKISNLLSPKELEILNNDEEVLVDNHNHETLCSVLPSLCEGHIIGLRRFLPSGSNFEPIEQFWSYKHGLALPSKYFIKIWFDLGGPSDMQWFPSAFVLQGRGLIPAPLSIRVSKANEGLELFLKILEAWNFFGGGLLKINGAFRLPTSPEISGWSKASSNNYKCMAKDENDASFFKNFGRKISSFQARLSNIDFRTPRPVLGPCFADDTSDPTSDQNKVISSSNLIVPDKCSQHFVSQASATKLRPLFMNRTRDRKNSYSDGVVSHSSTLQPARSKEMHSNENGPISDLEALQNSKGSIQKHNSEALPRNNFRSVPSDAKLQQVVNKASTRCQQVSGKVEKAREEVVSTKVQETTVQTQPLPASTAHDGELTRGANEQTVTKKRAEQQIDPSDINAKVMHCHAKGQLGSLSIPQLKSFLGTKKAKLSGKKDELIQRVISLLQ